jgi:hypothetical protein
MVRSGDAKAVQIGLAHKLGARVSALRRSEDLGAVKERSRILLQE